MTEAISTGVEQPKLTIDGKEYVVKFSRAAMYRLDKAGFDLATLPREINGWFPRKGADGAPDQPGRVRLSVLIDVLHTAIGPEIRCTPEDLADLVYIGYDADPAARTAEIGAAIVVSLSKMRPQARVKLQEPAATEGAIQ